MSNGVAGKPQGFVFTGKHMVLVMVAFFGTVISVNFFMAYNAIHSWSGIVVPNTYVASQQFNDKVAIQRAIVASGIKGKLSVEGGVVQLTISHPEKGPIDVEKAMATFRRPVGEGQDFVVELTRAAPGLYKATHEVRSGQWIAEVKATDGETVVVHQANRIMVLGEQ